MANPQKQIPLTHLILTHLQPKIEKERLLNDAGKHFTKPITVAVDRMRLVVYKR